MSTFNFEFNGQKFEIKAPTGATFDQAKAVFDQQTASGGLAGFRVGDVLSPATQAAAGLAAAQSQLTQGLASLANKLPGGTNLSSITASIGALGQGAAAQVTGALQGGAAAFNSLTTGASGATASISAALSGAGAGISLPSASAITGALTGAAGQVGSLASTAVGTLSGLIKATPTAGIDIADFAKQSPALSGLGSMSLPDVTGVLAQTTKLIGQGADTISNSLGAGKFGFDAKQLEQAGLVKPGTAAAFLSLGNNDIVSVLKSPTVWTGKDGVKSLGGLLSNSGLQDKVQQGLMTSGVNNLKLLGIPTDKLTPQALGGLATNAATSVSDTVNWAKNVPGLSTDLKAKFDATAVNGAFAVNLAQTKVDAPVLQETKPVAADNTVNSATVDDASKRVVGDDRIPGVSVSSDGREDAKIKIREFLNFVVSIEESVKALEPTIEEYQRAGSLTQDQWNQLNAELQVIKATYNARIALLQEVAIAAYDAISGGNKENIGKALQIAIKNIKLLQAYVVEVIKKIKALANKIVT